MATLLQVLWYLLTLPHPHPKEGPQPEAAEDVGNWGGLKF